MIPGPGVAAGGLEGQFLKKISDADYDTGWFRVGFINLAGIPSDNDALQQALDDKSAIGHTHDDRYYTEAEVATLIAQALVTVASNLSSAIAALSTVYASQLLVPDTVTAAGYTIQATDRYAAKRLTNAGLVTITVPLNATIAVPIGARCRFAAEGAAGATIVPESVGVTILCRGNLDDAAQGSIFELHKVATNTWWLLGDVQ